MLMHSRINFCQEILYYWNTEQSPKKCIGKKIKRKRRRVKKSRRRRKRQFSFSSFLFLTHSSLEELLSLATFTVVKSSFLKGRKVAACLIQFQHFAFESTSNSIPCMYDSKKLSKRRKYISTVFENHRKSLSQQHCELGLHLQKFIKKYQKWSILASF